MNTGLRVALLVVALALLAGCIYAGWARDVPTAAVYGALAATCGTLERIVKALGK